MVVDTGMKLTCGRAELADKLAVVGRGLSTRPSVQIFAGVLMQVAAGRLELSATDMELSLRTGLDVEVQGEGSAVVPGRLLADIVRQLPAEEVELEYQAEESSLHVTSGSATYRLRTYAVEDFPRLPDVTGIPTSSLDSGPLLEAVGGVSRAAGRDESRPVLTGIFVRLAGRSLVMVATDSYRLSVKETELAQDAPELEAIVPARALDELRRIGAGGGEIELGVLDNHVAFGAGGVWLTTRKIDGQFPDHTKLIPEAGEFVVDLSLPRSELLEVVRRMAVMAHRSSPLRLRLAEGELTISVQTPDVGEARESLPVAYTGEPMEIGFNAAYLQDGVESVSGDDLSLKLINPLRPGLVQGVDDGFRYLIMPIRLPD
ncbi:MAG TPA: DNA polymerase III subunit beta [Gaiellaceae bacterium]|nr:DNA polymerase III subunit beta [Gaiellaceae bacterium]